MVMNTRRGIFLLLTTQQILTKALKEKSLLLKTKCHLTLTVQLGIPIQFVSTKVFVRMLAQVLLMELKTQLRLLVHLPRLTLFPPTLLAYAKPIMQVTTLIGIYQRFVKWGMIPMRALIVLAKMQSRFFKTCKPIWFIMAISVV